MDIDHERALIDTIYFLNYQQVRLGILLKNDLILWYDFQKDNEYCEETKCKFSYPHPDLRNQNETNDEKTIGQLVVNLQDFEYDEYFPLIDDYQILRDLSVN